MLPNLRKWHRENRRAFAELSAILVSTALLFVVSGRYQFAQRLHEFCRDYMEVGRLIVVTLFLSVAFSVFSARRWLDLRRGILLANTDGLTGLSNKRRFVEILEAEIARSARHGRPLSLIMFDVDWFKRVNDQFGHSGGDELLRGLADLTCGALRELDSVARWGGDEFVVIATETDLGGALNLAERLRSLIARSAFPRVGSATASFGVAEMGGGETVDSFIRKADRQLYRAKEAGRNNVQGAETGKSRGGLAAVASRHD